MPADFNGEVKNQTNGGQNMFGEDNFKREQGDGGDSFWPKTFQCHC